MFGLDLKHYRDIIKVFENYPEIEKVLIFGSRAKGTEKPYSDFDLAIITKDMSEATFSKLWSDLNDLPLIFKLDIIHFNSLNDTPFKKKIMSEGKAFYTKKNSL